VSRPRKVVVIGAKGYEMSTSDVRVDCFSWELIKNVTNLRDYDTVVINLLGIIDETSRNQVPWNDVVSVLNVCTALEILQHGGEIIVAGDPRFTVRLEDHKDLYKDMPFLHWTGIEFQWDDAPGDTIVFSNDYRHRNFENYMKKLAKWVYSLSWVRADLNILSDFFNFEYMESKGLSIDIHKDFFCVNRYENALAFILRLAITKKVEDCYSKRTEVVSEYGPVVFLPRIEASQDETLTIVLRDVCGIEASLPEPEWLADYKAPGQKTVDEEINRIRGEIEAAWERLQEARKKREQVRTCLKLLYEREAGLEPAVRDVLRGLGAHIEDPTEPNKEDGWITVSVGDQTFEGVLEVKSTRSDQFGEDGIRQLLDWIDRGIQLRQKKYKGIFIGNSCVDKPVTERPWPFSDSWCKSVELHSMCALTTKDLYIVHLLKSTGKLDLDAFWQDIFQTNGILDNKKYIDLLTRQQE
jgi:hypothetical protein